MVILKLIRWSLGQLLIFLNFSIPPKQVKRSTEEQKKADEQTKSLALYQFAGCPFCIKVRRKIKALSLSITLKDAKNDTDARNTLLEKGGKIKVPCLHIVTPDGEKWLYESSAINEYLEQRFANSLNV